MRRPRRFAISGLCLCCSIAMLLALAGREVLWAAPDADEPVYMGFAVEGCPVIGEQVQELREVLGCPPDMVVFYLQWPSPRSSGNSGFPLDSVRRVWDSGAVPCVTWEPMYIDSGQENTIPASLITGGDYDAYIRRFAATAGEWGYPVLVRFAHEMNLDRYHWGGVADQYGPESPGLYRTMFRHVVEVARDAGGTNILWVFCPNAESVPGSDSAGWNTLADYYPGDGFVDMLGLDGYDWGRSRVREKHGWTSAPRTFKDIFLQPSRQLHELSPSKPLMVFETASVGSLARKREWLEDALSVCPDLGISGIVWFHVKKENDWSLPRGIALSGEWFERVPLKQSIQELLRE